MKKGLVRFQLGKGGVTENFIETIRKSFKTREIVKISVLRSFSRGRDEVNEMAEKICKELGKKYTYKIIGFTINLKKWRKARY
ncbi:MAG: YhbY family RNA-binding protein [Nanoarchaeota archaeon]|nr:YhbY family RNA-binding protein [Nanoarchaeota archaeon]